MSSKKELIRQIETHIFEKKYWKEIAENYQNLYESECNINSSLRQKIDHLEKQLNNDKRYKDLIEHTEQQDLKIASLIKQRDNWKDLFESLDTLVTEKQFEINGLQHKLSEVADMCIRVEKQRDNWKNLFESLF